MKWNSNDLELYGQAKEYVDCLVLPLIPVTLQGSDEELNQYATQNQLLTIYTNEIEKEYKGRVFLSPQYTYSPNADRESEVTRLNNWTKEALTKPFKHIIYLTMDNKWKKVERDLDGELIWIPMFSVDTSNPENQKVIRDQINQVTELIRTYWS